MIQPNTRITFIAPNGDELEPVPALVAPDNPAYVQGELDNTPRYGWAIYIKAGWCKEPPGAHPRWRARFNYYGQTTHEPLLTMEPEIWFAGDRFVGFHAKAAEE